MTRKVWILVGPSGTGKTTLAKELPQRVPQLRRAVTCTTRAPRPGEHEGVDYYFVTSEQFDFLLASGKLLESTTYGGNRYGLPADQFVGLQDHDVLCVLDMVGVENLRMRLTPDTLRVVYMESPSAGELEKRMRARGSSDDEIARRLAMREQEECHPDHCDYRLATDAPYEEVRAELERLILKARA